MSVLIAICIAIFIVLIVMVIREIMEHHAVRHGKLIYLACPYTHKDPNIRQQRYKKSLMAAVHLIRLGYNVFAPLIYTVPLEVRTHEPYDKWLDLSITILSRCDELWVLTLPGWETSRGVMEEINFAKEHRIPIKYIDFASINHGDNSGEQTMVD